MKEKTYRRETFATMEDFVNEAKRLVKDKNNFKFINREKYDMCIAKMNINGVYGEAFGIMEDGRIILTHVVKYSVDRGTKKCYSFYRDERGVTNPELARKVERQRRKNPDGVEKELSLIDLKIDKGNLGTNKKENKDKVINISEYKLRKGVKVPYRLKNDFFRKVRNGYYTKNFLIYDKLGDRIVDIKDNVEDFVVKNKKNIIVIFAASAIGLSIFVEAVKPTPIKIISSTEQKSFISASVKEKEDYLLYLSNINRDYLLNDDNITYYLEETNKTLDKYRKSLLTNNEQLILKTEDLLDQQVAGLKFLLSSRLKELNETVELDIANLSYVDGELTSNKEKSFSK